MVGEHELRPLLHKSQKCLNSDRENSLLFDLTINMNTFPINCVRMKISLLLEIYEGSTPSNSNNNI